jgi:hypothetical protein
MFRPVCNLRGSKTPLWWVHCSLGFTINVAGRASRLPGAGSLWIIVQFSVSVKGSKSMRHSLLLSAGGHC